MGEVGKPRQAVRRWSNATFAALFLVSLVLFGRILWPFLMPVLLGAFLAILFTPAQDLLCRRLPKHRTFCAGVTTASVVLLICVPAVLVTFFVLRELVGAAEYLRAALEQVDLRAELVRRLPAAQRWLDLESNPIQGALASAMARGANFAGRLVGAGTGLVIDLFLTTIALYYFLLDGRRLVGELGRLLPLEGRYFDAFVKELKDVTYAIMYGNTLTAALQGLVGFLGLSIARVPNPAVWAAVMGVVALIPLGGTALVWAPLGLGLIVTGRVAGGLFVLAWGALAVSTIDNLIRPKLCGARMGLHPLVVFLSMFGGLAVFGVMGLVLGPLIAALFMAMVRIYRRDFALAAPSSSPVEADEPKAVGTRVPQNV